MNQEAAGNRRWATCSDQYDSEGLRWGKIGAAESVRTQFYAEYMQPFVEDFSGKRILDIGAGKGWLVDAARQHGATKAVGIEPSAQHIAIARERYPEIDIRHCDLAGYIEHAQYDMVTAVMSFSHVGDIDAAFGRLAELIAPGGRIIIAVPGYEYTKTEHAGCLSVTPIDHMAYLAVTQCAGGQIIEDIVRTSRAYTIAAAAAGFTVDQQIAMKPTPAQLARSPRFQEIKEQAISTLLTYVC